MENKFHNETNFIGFSDWFEMKSSVMPTEIIFDNRLSFKAKGVYFQIVAFSNSPEHKVYISSLQHWSKDGRDSIRKGIEELEKFGYIEKTPIRNERGHFKGYRYTIYPKPISPISENPTSVNPFSENPTHNNIIKINNNKDSMSSEENDVLEETNTDIVGRSNKVTSAPSSSKKDIQLVEEVILYLNEKTGKKFQSSTKSYQKEILGRLKTGDYTLEDFKTVIDFKCKEWLNNEKMNKYLRPDTLFRDSNFNKYLNEAISSEKHIKETEDAIRIESFENKVDDERMEELFSLMGMGI